MSLFGKLKRGAIGFATGGLSEIGRALNQKPGMGPGYQMKPLADPSQIRPDQTLVDALGGIGDKQQNNLNNIFEKTRRGYAGDSAVRGVAPDSPYAANRIGQAETMANQGLKGSLEGILGDTSYNDFLGQQGFDRDMSLAREIGRLNKKSTLEEILGGLGGAAQTGGTLYGALGGRGRSPAPMDLGLSGSDIDLDLIRGYTPNRASLMYRSA